MKVTLLSCTPDALDLLLRTKNTRLKFNSDPATWTPEQKEEHLAYMKDTIKSSWEFVDYTFEISGVTRAFTHQLVRTRTGSYAQESQRTVDVRENEVFRPALNQENKMLLSIWDSAVDVVKGAYSAMIDRGVPAQDARGILPTNVTTSIIAKFSLRTLHEMAKVRLCTRTQGEYQDVFREMRRLVIDIHPWVLDHAFLEVQCVSNGTCAFPRYGRKDCPVWVPELDWFTEEARGKMADRFWSIRHVATPRAKGGKT